MARFGERIDDTFIWDLSQIVPYLVEKFDGIKAIYLFGSRAYKTGSRRSDIDLLVYADPLVSHGIAESVRVEIPPLDIFRTRDLQHAVSVANDSQIIATHGRDLVEQLDAICLWDAAGSNITFEDWKQPARIDVQFVATRAMLPPTYETKIFIGHGHAPDWRKLVALCEELHLPYDEFNAVPIAGETTIARLEEMLADACFALLVSTAEDKWIDGSAHARENVIHEIGLFQGKLGFKRAIVLLEEGCQGFSNLRGLTQIGFPKGEIEKSFDKIRETLKSRGINSASH